MPPERCEKDGDGQAEGEEENADLVQKARAHHQAEWAPQPGIVGAGEAGHEEGRHRPEDEVEGIHRVKASEGQELGSDSHREGGERLREAPPAKLAGQSCRQPYEKSEEQRRHETHGEQRIAEKPAYTRQRHDGQRRMIHIPPVEMVGAGEIVELVAEQAVAPPRGELQSHHGQRGGQDEDRRRAVRGVSHAEGSAHTCRAPSIR
jgi:hypothetical protein